MQNDLTQLLTISQSSAHSHRLLRQALDFIVQQDWLQAQACCDEWLLFETPNALSWQLQGLIALGQGQTENAIERLSQSIHLNPNEFAVWFNISQAFLVVGDLQRAHKSIQRALVLRSGDPAALALRDDIVERMLTQK